MKGPEGEKLIAAYRRLATGFGSNFQRNILQMAINQTEICLYLPFSDRFGTVNGHCSCAVQSLSEKGMYNLISFWFNKTWKIFLSVQQRICRPLTAKRKYSWPRGLRLLAILNAQLRTPPENPRDHRSTYRVLRGLKGALNWAPMMPRGSSV